MAGNGDLIISTNTGSSSIKFQGGYGNSRELLFKGSADRIGQGGSIEISVLSGPTAGASFKSQVSLPDHRTALNICFDALRSDALQVIESPDEVVGIGHRIVHGGGLFSHSVVIDPTVEQNIEDLCPLAPLHNPAHLQGYRAAREIFPDSTHVAVFDTAFHQTMPDFAYTVPIPAELGPVRNYGFHGTSHLFVSRVAARLTGMGKSDFNGITMHMGNGVSLCAIKGGSSFDTTMGLTPLAGPMMGTRSGSIDPSILLHLLETVPDLDAAKLGNILNKQSGALAVSKRSMHWGDIQSGAEAGDDSCRLAIDMFTYQMRKCLGAYLTALSDFGPVHALVFTAGIGENRPLLRERIVQNMEPLGIYFDKSVNDFRRPKEPVLISKPGSFPYIFVIPTNEEEVIKSDVIAILNGVVPDQDYVYPFESEFSKIIP